MPKQIQGLRRRPPGRDPICVVDGPKLGIGPSQRCCACRSKKAAVKGSRFQINAIQKGGVLIGTVEALESESRAAIEGVALGDAVVIHVDFVWVVVRANASSNRKWEQ